MLTRIEIDGFKSFESFSVDLAPFSVVLGSNASGKSNLFDAIELLSKLASGSVGDALQGLRGEASELFRRTTRGSEKRIRFAAEVLIDPTTRDPWGNEITLSHTRLRYEVALSLRESGSGGAQVVVDHEAAFPLLRKDDRWLDSMRPSDSFRKHYLLYKKSRQFLSTSDDGDGLVFHIAQDGHQGRKRPAKAASASVLSTMSDADFPHLFALREELRSWRVLQLDPAMLRRPAPLGASEFLQPDGANLAAVLTRIKLETARADQPAGALSAIAAELNSLIPGVKSIDAAYDKAAGEFRTSLVMRDGVPFSSRVVSDGTLRVLAILTLLNDPAHRGVLCFEEPENGVHPGRLRDFIHVLRAAVPAPAANIDVPGEPLRQVLLNSHSPVVLSALFSNIDPHQRQRVLLADMVSRAGMESGEVRRMTRLRPVHASPQGTLIDFEDASESDVSAFEVQQLLEAASADA